MYLELKLNSNLLRAVEVAGFEKATDIQREAIPVVLTGKDLMASAQTGTGKTAAFVLPALEKLSSPSKGKGKGCDHLWNTAIYPYQFQISAKGLGKQYRRREIAWCLIDWYYGS